MFGRTTSKYLSNSSSDKSMAYVSVYLHVALSVALTEKVFGQV